MRLKGHTAWYKDCGFPWVILTIHDYRTTKDLLVRLNSLFVTTRPSLVFAFTEGSFGLCAGHCISRDCYFGLYRGYIKLCQVS